MTAPLAVNALETATVLVSFALAPLALLLAWGLASFRVRRGVPSGTAWRRSVAEVGMVAGTLPWLFLVLTPRGGSGGVQPVPFADLIDLASADPRTIVEQLVGNLLLFFLAGVFVPLRFRVGLLAVFLGGALGAALVETAQFAFGTGRVASIDDVLLNAIGALLGALASRRWWRGSPSRVAPTAESTVLRSAGRDWRVTSFEVSRGTDRAARC
ncbi:VanZ family protein [Glycomyces sp. TRM65418]|uniref:VanZ family protein n=1 Tax=Glycomyces sp. TRM65418 TaxID=2867006 RepID=UPI001CE4D160|nr:VanZ family protein [Glycomyces sp. TRM65418]MCC3763578.1 VanZ family protein [Glycomyces sp. TRM65418]QZD57561.1 VanZ family protein [Glycomyces sp. TRM65418]